MGNTNTKITTESTRKSTKKIKSDIDVHLRMQTFHQRCKHKREHKLDIHVKRRRAKATKDSAMVTHSPLLPYKGVDLERLLPL